MKLREGKPGKLTLFEADLTKAGSFDAATSGVTYVFHTASPFVLKVEDPQRDLIDPAVNGTRTVLESVIKNRHTVKRTVVTSTIGAVLHYLNPPKPEEAKDEDDWNTESTIDNEPYSLSKVSAEREAWRIAEENNLDLVTINPSAVTGPAASSRPDATSIDLLNSILQGGVRPFAMPTVDVRDLALAHIAAAENPLANGRYIVSHQESAQPGEIAGIVKKHFPNLHIDVEANKKFDDPERPVWFRHTRAQKELGIKLRSTEESIVDMTNFLINSGLAKVTPVAN